MATMRVGVKEQDGEEGVLFQVKGHTKLRKIMDAWCKKKEIPRDAVQFQWNGEPVDDEATLEGLGIPDGSSLDVLPLQPGNNNVPQQGQEAEEQEEEEVPAARAPQAAGVQDAQRQPDQRPPVQTISFGIVSQGGDKVLFKVKSSVKLIKVFIQWCEKKNVDKRAVRFVFQGERVEEEKTPDQLGMEDGDTIDAFVEQLGGACKRRRVA